MYLFNIKNDRSAIQAIFTRLLLILAALASWIYPWKGNSIFSMCSSGILLVSAIFFKTISRRAKINKWASLFVASLLLLVTFRNFFALPVIFIFWVVLKVLNANAVITIDDDGIIIKRIYHPEHHSWNEFSNVVVKDGLLTLDYNNNKVLQLLIKELKTSEEERKFNQYCRRKLVNAT